MRESLRTICFSFVIGGDLGSATRAKLEADALLFLNLRTVRFDPNAARSTPFRRAYGRHRTRTACSIRHLPQQCPIRQRVPPAFGARSHKIFHRQESTRQVVVSGK
jgi:hypothetical protein